MLILHKWILFFLFLGKWGVDGCAIDKKMGVGIGSGWDAMIFLNKFKVVTPVLLFVLYYVKLPGWHAFLG